MKKLLVLLFCSVLLFACSNDVMPSTTTPVEPVEVEVVEDKPKVEEVKEPIETVENETIDEWKYFKVDETYNVGDLTFRVRQVVTSDNVLYSGQTEVKAIVVYFQIKNNSDHKHLNYLSLATLVTSDGEQVTADYFSSDKFESELHEGVAQEGNLTFVLHNSDVNNLDWIKIVWDTEDLKNDTLDENELKINLK